MLYDRKEGNPDEISKKFFGEHLSLVTENLVKQGLIDLPELKEILDNKSVYWGGIKQNFEEILASDDAIGKLAWKIYHDQTGIEATSEEVKSLIYDGSKAPWKFTLMACVVYD
ncbi:MAG: hypothetical protein EU539_01235 [Promethearchaeota archaeon]|nr:MAG: hypothetical protein EU539_01235 [Candidatus Lokiarchaeota archaeon]